MHAYLYAHYYQGPVLMANDVTWQKHLTILSTVRCAYTDLSAIAFTLETMSFVFNVYVSRCLLPTAVNFGGAPTFLRSLQLSPQRIGVDAKYLPKQPDATCFRGASRKLNEFAAAALESPYRMMQRLLEAMAMLQAHTHTHTHTHVHAYTRIHTHRLRGHATHTTATG